MERKSSCLQSTIKRYTNSIMPDEPPPSPHLSLSPRRVLTPMSPDDLVESLSARVKALTNERDRMLAKIARLERVNNLFVKSCYPFAFVYAEQRTMSESDSVLKGGISKSVVRGIQEALSAAGPAP